MKSSSHRKCGAHSHSRRRRLDSFLKSALCFVAALSGPAVALAAIPSTERAALISLYNSTNGSTWLSQDNWTTAPGVFSAPGSECSWYGIVCDANQVTVQKISLDHNKLTGSLSELGTFANLQYFSVVSNQLTGALPTLSALHSLQTFDARNNKLNGAIPTLTGLSNLQALRLGNNQLSGPIPSLTGLINLQVLRIYQNQLTGPIPPLADLKNLTYFDVGYNQLVGTIPALPNSPLVAFTAPANHLTGSIPDLSNYPNLFAFNVAGNQLSGSIPSLAKLTQLDDFEVGHNQLTGSVPDLSSQTKLEYFDVGFNQLSGALPLAPATLVYGESAVCPNALTPTPDASWDAATGFKPWYIPCANPPRTVTFSAGPHGTVSPSGQVAVAYSGKASASIVADAGYAIRVAGTCGAPVFTPNSVYTYVTSPVTADCTVEVTFVPATTFSFTSNISRAVYGQNVVLAAAVGGGATTATGSITFFDGDNPSAPLLADVPLANGQAIFATSTLAPGNHKISFSYAGDDTHTSTSSMNVRLSPALQIDKGVTAVTLTAPVNAIFGGIFTHVAVTANVSVLAPASGKLTGYVIVSDGVDNCSMMLPQTTCDLRLTSQGTRTLTATYQGDANFASSTSNSSSIFIGPRTSFTLTASSTPSVTGQDVLYAVKFDDPTITAPVSLTMTMFGGSALPAGMINVVNGQGNTTLSFPRAGIYDVIASYAGDSAHAPSGVKVTQLVRPAATHVTIGAPPLAVTYFETNFYAHVEVDAPGKGIPTGTIRLLDQAGNGCDIYLPVTYCTFGLYTVKTDTITGSYGGDDDFLPSTASVPLPVQADQPSGLYPTEISLTSTVDPTAPFQATALVATVSGDHGFGITGMVVFSAGGERLCQAFIRPVGNQFKAYCAAALGTASQVSATYYGDALHSASSTAKYQLITAGTPAFNANQFGVTGSWYNPATSGQGLEIEVLPDYAAPGKGVLFAGWFTYDEGMHGEQRWYTLQGTVDSASAAIPLEIFQAVGGSFNTWPTVSATNVGSASLTFTDCTHATLRYTFTRGSDRTGVIPLTRLSTPTSCGQAGDNGVTGTDFFLSGAWYNAATSGQGLVLDISPTQTTLFGAWYTYALNGWGIAGGTSQRWFTLQINNYVPGSRSVANVPIYAPKGGIFDDPISIMNTQVGIADISFASCRAMSLHYTFTSGEFAGRSGTISMTPVGPTPSGCK